MKVTVDPWSPDYGPGLDISEGEADPRSTSPSSMPPTSGNPSLQPRSTPARCWP